MTTKPNTLTTQTYTVPGASDGPTHRLGRLVVSRGGIDERYGEIYRAPGRGFVAGVRTHASPELGLYLREWFSHREDAEAYLRSLGV